MERESRNIFASHIFGDSLSDFSVRWHISFLYAWWVFTSTRPLATFVNE